MRLNILVLLIPLFLQTSASRTETGIHVDLDEQRLLEFEDGTNVWVSESEKIDSKPSGERFFDM